MDFLQCLDGWKNSRQLRKIERERQLLVLSRQSFYEHILRTIQAPPDQAAIVFGQDKLFECSSISQAVIEAEMGVLYFTVDSHFFGKTYQHSFSLYQTGDIFRYGLLFYGGLENAPLLDWQNELQSVWPGVEPVQHDREGLTMYEWTFFEPLLVENSAIRERFTLGTRHMHARVLRIIRDYALTVTAHQASA